MAMPTLWWQQHRGQAATLEQVIFAEFTHPQAERLAERLAERTDWTGCSSPTTDPQPWKWR